MHINDWLQFALYLGLLTLITKPMGLYLMQVLDTNGRTWLDPVLKPLERITYKLLGVDPQREQGWKQYTFAMLAFITSSPLWISTPRLLDNLVTSTCSETRPADVAATSADGAVGFW